jgi:tripartite-type tricarboxylate transporter receptor subunit TctC
VVEAGLPDLVVLATAWLLVPKGTPTAIIERLSQATKKALADPELKRIYAAAGTELPADPSPEAAAKLLQSEIRRWGPIVKQAGLKLR